MRDVLLIGWDDVSHSEGTPAVCPRLATFREEAAEVQGFSHPVCSQTRAAILFGSYARKIGTMRDIGFLTPVHDTPPASLPTLPGTMRAAGYRTALVGKWHCGPAPSGADWTLGPRERGYDDWLAGTRLNLNSGTSIDYFDWQRVDVVGALTVVDDHHARYATEAQLEAATSWWYGSCGGPRFMHVALNAPHGPLHAPPASLLAGWPRPGFGARNRDKYLAMLRSADTALGELLDVVGPETAVFLYSDNGTGRQSAAASVNPDHTKETTFDPGTRVLLLGRYPGAEVGYDPRLQHVMDVSAGICAVAGLQAPPEWDARTTPRGSVLSEAQLSDGSVDRACRTVTHKLRQVTPLGESLPTEELYDLVGDPGEESPLDLSNPDNEAVLAFLRGKLDAAAL